MSNFQYITLPRPPFSLRVLAKIRHGRVVWLQDYEGEILPSIATADKCGRLTCPVAPWTKVGYVILLSGGRIHPRSRSTHITQWRYA